MLRGSLHCVIEHFTFRGTLSVAPYPSLVAFSQVFATRRSTQRIIYRFDAPPAWRARGPNLDCAARAGRN